MRKVTIFSINERKFTIIENHYFGQWDNSEFFDQWDNSALFVQWGNSQFVQPMRNSQLENSNLKMKCILGLQEIFNQKQIAGFWCHT